MQTVTNRLSFGTYRRCAETPPATVWQRENVWINPYEKKTILMRIMREFLSASQDDINSAASAYRKVTLRADEVASSK